jgi:hypothetical protein
MPEYEDDLVDLPEEIPEITPENADAHRPDPAKGVKGIRDDLHPERSEVLELEAAEAVVLGEVEEEADEGEEEVGP